jgi:hypothetical protein
VSNEGVEPGQIWEVGPVGAKNTMLMLITELEGGPFGSCVGVDLASGQLTSLFQTTMGMLEENSQARRIL